MFIDDLYQICIFSRHLNPDDNPGHAMWNTTPHLVGKSIIRAPGVMLSCRRSEEMSLHEFVTQYRLVVKCYASN